MTDISGIPGEVVYLFERFAFDVIDRGFTRYSARTILHHIRWHIEIDKGQRGFKCNNNWTPALARWFMEKYPAHAGFFETRASPALHDMTDYTGPYMRHIP